jgi:serine/threonine protein kinase
MPFPGKTKQELNQMIEKINPDFSAPIFKKISKAGKSFLKRGLTKDPKKRPSAKELLSDPWITKLHGVEPHLDKT